MNPLVPRLIDRPTVVDLDAPDWAAMDTAKIIAAPEDPADWPRWRAVLDQWRAGVADRHPIGAAAYEQPEGRWAQTCFAIAQIWLWDELLYDFARECFTPERLLADADRRFGGFDGIVLWHAYPVIGIDDRNQWDFYRDVPGLTELVRTLQDAGVAVFVDYNPWDTGTRRGDSDAAELVAVVTELGADGIFLDTLKEADADLVAGPRGRPAGHRAGERIHPAAGPARRAPAVLGAVVRRLGGSRGDPIALRGAAAPAAPRTPLAPPARRGVAVGLSSTASG